MLISGQNKKRFNLLNASVHYMAVTALKTLKEMTLCHVQYLN